MALFKIHKGLSENLMKNVPNAKDGFAYFTTDDGKFYIDVAGDGTSNSKAVININRIPLNAVKADIATTIEATEMGTNDDVVYPILAFNITDITKNLVEARYGKIGIKNGTLVIPSVDDKDEILISNEGDGRNIVIEKLKGPVTAGYSAGIEIINETSGYGIEIKSGPGIKVAQDPTEDLELATKQYVDNKAPKDHNHDTVYVKKSGDTMTGGLTAPNFQTGTNANNYFQTQKFRGEGDASKYYHAIDFGYTNHNQVDFHEYGGLWNFYKNTAGTANGGTLVASIQSDGFHGNLKGNADTADKWKTSRKFTIGNNTQTVDGSSDVTWSLADIGIDGDFLHTTGEIAESADGNKTFTGQTTFADDVTIHSADDDTTKLVISTESYPVSLQSTQAIVLDGITHLSSQPNTGGTGQASYALGLNMNNEGPVQSGWTPIFDNDVITLGYLNDKFNTYLVANDAMVFKGVINSDSQLPSSHEAGWTYRVGTAGTYVGVKCEVGDLIICITDGISANNAHWTVAQTNIDGAVVGPASATSDDIAVFDGATGKIIKDSGKKLSNYSTTDHTHYSLSTIADKRNANTTPSEYSSKLIFQGLKTQSAISGPTSGYYSLLGLRGWNDESGGHAQEIAFNNNGIYTRMAKDSSTWNDWKQITTNDQLPTLIKNNTEAITTSDEKVTSGHVPVYDGTTGKLLKDSGFTLGTSVPANAKFTDTIYTHPTSSGNKHIPSGGSSGQILRWASDGTATWGAEKDTTYDIFTGATSQSSGTKGLVPAPIVNQHNTYLKGDGKWTTVNWTDLSGRPSEFTPASHIHDDRYYTETEIDEKLKALPVAGHNHDDRYYTETEMDTKLSGKKDTQSKVSDPSVSITATSINFINSISQNEQGVITATKQAVRNASASQSGVVSTGTQTFAGEKTFNGNIKVGSSASIGTNGYIQGTWLQTTKTSDKVGNFATIDGDGWIYYRTPTEVRSDIGTYSTTEIDNKIPSIECDNTGRDGSLLITLEKTVTTPSNSNPVITLKATHSKQSKLTNGYTTGATSNITGTYGGSSTIKIPKITVDAQGHVTEASDQSITLKMPDAQTIGNGGLKINVGKTAVAGTGSFTANQSSDSTITLPVYTITETDNLLSGKAPTKHTHTKSDITDFDHTHNTLTLKTGNTSTTYNGGTDVIFEVKASDLGLGQALRFIGFATVDIEDGSTTNPTITGYDFTKVQTGDVVISKDSTYEYVWTSADKWERLGPDTSGTGEKYTFTATAGQTVFTLPGTFADPSLLTVFYNGVLMTEVDNYTITNGTLNLVGFTANDNDKIIVMGLTDVSSSSNLQGDVSDLKDRASRALYNNITNIMTSAGRIQMDSSYTPTDTMDVVTKKFTDNNYSKWNHNHDGVYVENGSTDVGAFYSYDSGDSNYYWGTDDATEGSYPVLASNMGVGYAAQANQIQIATNNTTTKQYLTMSTTTSGYGTLNTKTALYTENNVIFGAAWNDYAEYRCGDVTEGGYCIVEKGDDTLVLSSARMIPGANLTSDTFGFAIGKSDTCQTPVAVSGRVLAYPYEPVEEFKKNIGHPVCSGPNGTVSIMTDEEYKEKGYCAIGTISAVPAYETWGSANVKVNGRVWIKVF